MIDKAAVTAVFEALGPERVARGLLDADGHTWEDCFLARAYGAAGELVRGHEARPQPQGREPPRAGAGGCGRSQAPRRAVDGGVGRRGRLRPPHHRVPTAGRGVAGGAPRSRAAAPRGGWARGAGDPRVGANAIPEAFIPGSVHSRGGCQLQQCRGGHTLQTVRQRPAAHRPGHRRKKA